MKVLMPIIRDILPTVNLIKGKDYDVRGEHILRLLGLWETGSIKFNNNCYMDEIDDYEIVLLYELVGIN